MSFMVKRARDERLARSVRAQEPARAGREPVAGLAELVSQPVRRGRGSGIDSSARLRALATSAFDAARRRTAGGAAGIQGEVARRRRARAAAPADPPAARAAAGEKITEVAS